MTFRHVTSSSRITRRSPHSRAHTFGARSVRPRTRAMECFATLSRVGVRVVALAARRRARVVSSSSAFGPPIARGSARAVARRPAPASIARPRASPSSRGSTLAAVAPEGLDAASHLADVAVDAWSVSGGTTLGARFAGVESKLFQAGLLPYLVYLWFLGRPAARTPPASNFGARFLLAFVFATIPAGIAAKTEYGDILANVDVLHGASESLLTVSNFLFGFGFAAALASSTEGAEGAEGADGADTSNTSAPLDSPVHPALALAVLVAVAGGARARSPPRRTRGTPSRRSGSAENRPTRYPSPRGPSTSAPSRSGPSPRVSCGRTRRRRAFARGAVYPSRCSLSSPPVSRRARFISFTTRPR